SHRRAPAPFRAGKETDAVARPMNRLPQSNDPLVAFARDLQALRKKAGTPPLATMSQHCGISAATLSNAHSGRKLPTWQTVNGYVLACGGDPEEWSLRWESLRLKTAGIPGDLYRDALRRWERTSTLTPSPVTDESELRLLLQTLLDFNGLSHRSLARQAPGYSHVTYGAVLRGTRPIRAKILYQILIGCGVHSIRSQEAWFRVLSGISWNEGLEAGKLLARIQPKYRYAGDIDLKAIKTVVRRIEQSRGPLLTDAPWRDHIDELRSMFETVLTLLLRALKNAETDLPFNEAGSSLRHVEAHLFSHSVPHAPAINALVLLALPFHRQLQTRVTMALKNAGDLLRKAENGDLEVRDQDGVRYRLTPLPAAPPKPRQAQSEGTVSDHPERLPCAPRCGECSGGG
ncbi:hypothetical protein ACWF94_29035, partial [Streptomyces sp. NPDC055078]